MQLVFLYEPLVILKELHRWVPSFPSQVFPRIFPPILLLWKEVQSLLPHPPWRWRPENKNKNQNTWTKWNQNTWTKQWNYSNLLCILTSERMLTHAFVCSKTMKNTWKLSNVATWALWEPRMRTKKYFLTIFLEFFIVFIVFDHVNACVPWSKFTTVTIWIPD